MSDIIAKINEQIMSNQDKKKVIFVGRSENEKGFFEIKIPENIVPIYICLDPLESGKCHKLDFSILDNISNIIPASISEIWFDWSTFKFFKLGDDEKLTEYFKSLSKLLIDGGNIYLRMEGRAVFGNSGTPSIGKELIEKQDVNITFISFFDMKLFTYNAPISLHKECGKELALLHQKFVRNVITKRLANDFIIEVFEDAYTYPYVTKIAYVDNTVPYFILTKL